MLLEQVIGPKDDRLLSGVTGDALCINSVL